MNKTITLIIVALLCTISTNMRAEKVHDSFWGCSFGMTDSIAASELKKAGLEPLIDENGDIYLKDVKINNANFSLACLIMSPASGTLMLPPFQNTHTFTFLSTWFSTFPSLFW